MEGMALKIKIHEKDTPAAYVPVNAALLHEKAQQNEIEV
jgi:hypothetical protein